MRTRILLLIFGRVFCCCGFGFLSWLVHLRDFCWVYFVCFGLVLYGNMMAFTYQNKRKRGGILPTVVLNKLYILYFVESHSVPKFLWEYFFKILTCPFCSTCLHFSGEYSYWQASSCTQLQWRHFQFKINVLLSSSQIIRHELGSPIWLTNFY